MGVVPGVTAGGRQAVGELELAQGRLRARAKDAVGLAGEVAEGNEPLLQLGHAGGGGIVAAALAEGSAGIGRAPRPCVIGVVIPVVVVLPIVVVPVVVHDDELDKAGGQVVVGGDGGGMLRRHAAAEGVARGRVGGIVVGVEEQREDHLHVAVALLGGGVDHDLGAQHVGKRPVVGVAHLRHGEAVRGGVGGDVLRGDGAQAVQRRGDGLRAGGVGEDDGIVAHHHFVEVLFIRLEGHRGLPAGDILPGQLLESVEGAALGRGGERDGQRQKQRQRDDTKLLQTTQLLCKAFWKELPYAPIIQDAPPSSTAFHAPFHALFTEGCGRFFSGMRMAASAALSEKCAISRILHVGSYLLRKQRPLQGSTQKFPSKKHSAYKMKKIGNMVLHMDYLTKLRPRVHSILSYHHAYDRPRKDVLRDTLRTSCFSQFEW